MIGLELLFTRPKLLQRLGQGKRFRSERVKAFLSECPRVCVEQEAGVSGGIGNQLAPLVGNRNDRAATIVRITRPRDKLSIGELLQNSRHGRSIKQRLIGNALGVERRRVGEHAQDTPLLLRNIRRSQVGADWAHHGFARGKQRARQRAGIGLQAGRSWIGHKFSLVRPVSIKIRMISISTNWASK